MAYRVPERDARGRIERQLRNVDRRAVGADRKHAHDLLDGVRAAESVGKNMWEKWKVNDQRLVLSFFSWQNMAASIV